MKIILYSILTIIVSSLASSAKEQPAKGKVYTYKTVDGAERQLEIFSPKGHKASKKTVPGVLLFHGGGWSSGNRKAFAYQCKYFASRGLVAGTVTYQLSSKKGQQIAKQTGTSRKRECIPDVKSAIRWFKQHADELGIDPKRIIIGGGSAGAHISLLGTMNPDLSDPQDPKGYDTSVVAYLLFNPALTKNDAKDPAVDFVKHLSPEFPPAIVFFGTNDKWLKGWNAARPKMQDLGIKNTDIYYATDQPHGFFNKQPWKDITLIEADKFLKKLGLIEGDPTLALPKTGEKLVEQP